MKSHEFTPYIPISEASIHIFDYYAQKLRENADFLADVIRDEWEKMLPIERQAFEAFHAALYPDDLQEQQLAARRTLLRPYIEEQVAISNRFDSLFAA